MNVILCDECKKQIGTIEEGTYVECDDVFYGVEILCKDCKKIQSKEHWKHKSPETNILLHNQMAEPKKCEECGCLEGQHYSKKTKTGEHLYCRKHGICF